jgi:hypothetical protein
MTPEINEIRRAMQMDQSIDSTLRIAQQISSRFSAEDAKEIFDQLDYDSGTSLLPTAGRLAARGETATATDMLNGQAILDDKDSFISPTNKQNIRRAITEELGYSYGRYGTAQFEQTASAVMALYADRVDRGKTTVDTGLISDLSREVTGGVFSIGGQDFVSPDGVSGRQDVVNWIRSLDETNLPPVVDGDGTPIPAEDIVAGLEDGMWGGGTRFYLVPSGTPGRYFIGDARGRTPTRSTRPNQETLPLLMAAPDPSNQSPVFGAAVVYFDRNEITTTQSARPRRGRYSR